MLGRSQCNAGPEINCRVLGTFLEVRHSIGQLAEQYVANPVRQARNRRRLALERETSRSEHDGQRCLSMPSMARNMQSKQIVDKPLETLHIILGGQGGFSEISITPHAEMLRQKAVLSSRRNAAAAGRAVIAQATSMPKAGNASCQSPAAPEERCAILFQACRAILQAIDPSGRCASAPRSNDLPQTQPGQRVAVQSQAIDVLGRQPRSFDQQTEGSPGKVSVKLRRPISSYDIQNPPKILRWNSIGHGQPMQPARQQLSGCRCNNDGPALPHLIAVVARRCDCDLGRRLGHIISRRKGAFRRFDRGV